MGFFSKNKKEVELTAEGTKEIIPIVIETLDPNNPGIIPLRISKRNIAHIKGGTKPYERGELKIGEDYCQNLQLNQAEQFWEEEITTISFNLSAEKIMEIVGNKGNKIELDIRIRDQTYKNCVIKLKVDFINVIQRLKALEKISESSIDIDYEKGYNEGLKIRFTPGIEIISLTPEPKISIYFEDNTGIQNKNIDLYYLGKERKWGTYHFYIETEKVKIAIKEKIKDYIKETTLITLVVVTKGNIIIKKYRANFKKIRFTILNEEMKDKDFRTFTEADLIAVHMTKKADWNKIVKSKILGPRVMYASMWRPSIHTTLNHVVVPHGAAQEGWKDTDTAILMPFKELKSLNKKTFYGGPTVDVSFFAYIKLPKSTVIIDRKEGENGEIYVQRINEQILEMGFKVMGGGEWGWNEKATDVTKWLSQIAEKNEWQTISPHFYTPMGKIEYGLETERFNGKLLREMDPIEANKLFRKVLLEKIERWEPELWKKYGIHLKAWSNYWEKILK